MKLKKYLLIGLFSLFGITAFVNSQNFYYDVDTEIGEDTIEIGETLGEQGVTSNNSIINKLREVFKLTDGVYAQGDQKAFDYIKKIINIVLGLISFLALIMLIYGFYLMFFSKQEEGFTKAKKIVKGVVIALVILGLSFFIVNFLFYIYEATAGGAIESPSNI